MWHQINVHFDGRAERQPFTRDLRGSLSKNWIRLIETPTLRVFQWHDRRALDPNLIDLLIFVKKED